MSAPVTEFTTERQGTATEVYPGVEDALILLRDQYERYLRRWRIGDAISSHTFRTWLRYHSLGIERWDSVFEGFED